MFLSLNFNAVTLSDDTRFLQRFAKGRGEKLLSVVENSSNLEKNFPSSSGGGE